VHGDIESQLLSTSKAAFLCVLLRGGMQPNDASECKRERDKVGKCFAGSAQHCSPPTN
jgi:hypothetical protein